MLIALPVVLVVGGWFYLRWSVDRAADKLAGAAPGMVASVLERMEKEVEMGVPMTLVGEAPGAPRSGRLALVGPAPMGTSSPSKVGIRLLDTIAADTLGGWEGLCYSPSGRRDTLKFARNARVGLPTVPADSLLQVFLDSMSIAGIAKCEG